jgi:hypothetical protein
MGAHPMQAQYARLKEQLANETFSRFFKILGGQPA